VKTKIKIFLIAFFVLSMSASALPAVMDLAEGDCDSLEVLKLYSLFSEYHKNKDYKSALPYGWQVLNCDKVKFGKWIYSKMEDCLWYMHDSTEVSPEEKKSIEDTILSFYDMAIQFNGANAAYFQVRKAFVMETWLNNPIDEVIAAYEKSLEMNPDLSSYYKNRLGQLYINNQTDDNGYLLKAIELYSDLALKEQDNPLWNDILSQIVDDPEKLLEISKKAWQQDPENLAKAWNYASSCIRAERYELAIEPLEFLSQKSPSTINYWNQLATAYHKTNQLSKAEDAYLKLIELDSQTKDHYYNLALLYTDQGKYSKARQLFEKASDIGGGWGRAIVGIANLYEKVAASCTYDFKAKLVYKLAQDTYRRAFSVDPNLTSAKDRANALSGVVPSQEDYFFQGYKSGDVIQISGDCFSWIGKSITVP